APPAPVIFLLSLHDALPIYEVVQRPQVALDRPADGLVLVGVDQRADALVGEHLREQSFLDAAVDDVDPRHAANEYEAIRRAVKRSEEHTSELQSRGQLVCSL